MNCPLTGDPHGHPASTGKLEACKQMLAGMHNMQVPDARGRQDSGSSAHEAADNCLTPEEQARKLKR